MVVSYINNFDVGQDTLLLMELFQCFECWEVEVFISLGKGQKVWGGSVFYLGFEG